MTTSVPTNIEVTRSACHRSTWIASVDGYTEPYMFGLAGPFNIAKRAAEGLTQREHATFEWVQANPDVWRLHIIEPDPF